MTSFRAAPLCILLAVLTTAAAPAQPQRPWRGIAVDVARRFVAPARLRRLVDLAAHLRFNVVHLHLTDNEAWRLPSRAFPLLVSRTHYTETDLRALARYAQRRGVMLVPEIDMPAHNTAAIRAYSQLACGSADDTLCPRTASQFAARVVAEVARIFPAAYVHAGGDEVDGWSAQDRRTFEQRLNAYCRRIGKTMVVWDDESDAAPSSAVVEVWHLGDVARQAMRRGHRVIVASDGPFYFDAAQGDAAQEPPGTRYMSTLEEVYANGVPRAAFGVEAVLWSEHLRSDDDLWYMLLPRAIAASAVANGPPTAPWPVFRDRILPREFAWLLRHGYTFRVSNTLMSVLDGSARYASVQGNQNAAAAFVSRRRVQIALRSLVPNSEIFYRSGTQTQWKRYGRPFCIDAADGVRVDARTRAPNGRTGAITTLFVRRAFKPRGSAHFDDVVSP